MGDNPLIFLIAALLTFLAYIVVSELWSQVVAAVGGV